MDIAALVIFLVIFMTAAVKLHEKSLPERL
jgi:hypothetical protein